MSEARARAEVYGRSGGVDEILGSGEAQHWSHRMGRGQQGSWRPANGLHLASGTHSWLHAHPSLARAGGWHLASGTHLQTTPVWLARPWPGWFLIDDLVTDGGLHVLIFADIQPARPRLPFESAAAYAAHLGSLALIPA